MSNSVLALPESKDLAPLLSGLLGRDAAVVESDLVDPGLHVAWVRAFVDNDGEALVLAGGDLAFAMYAGAALAMIPPGRAEDAIAKGCPTTISRRSTGRSSTC